MKISKNLRLIIFSLGFLYINSVNLASSFAKLDINKTYESDTTIELEISSDEDSRYIVLPNGNKIKRNKVNFTSTANGTYTFSSYSKESTPEQKSISITNLRSKYLITPTPEVKLELSSTDTLSGVESMRFKNEGTGSSWSVFEPYKTEKIWTLNNIDGKRTVYAQYRDRAGNISDDVQDTIYLDLIGPISTLFKINNGATYTNNENVTLTINATDNYSTVSKMRFSNNNINFNEFDYATQAKWTIPSTDGLHKVYLELVDGVGNVGAKANPSINEASIILDKTLPVGTIDIAEAIENADGDFIVPSPEVTLNFQTFDALSGVKEVNIYEGSHKMTLPTIPPDNVNQTLSWVLNTDAPSTLVTLEVIDNAGNIYRTDSQLVTILSLKVVDFFLDNVFNPAVFRNGFNRLSWYGTDEATERPAGFSRQPMMNGGDIEFSLQYDINDSVLASYDMTWKYIITVTKPVGSSSSTPNSTVYESEEFTASPEDKSNMLVRGKYTIPYGLEKGSIVSIQIELNAECHTISGGTFIQSAVFPIEGGKAQIGEITGDIREEIKFNEVE